MALIDIKQRLIELQDLLNVEESMLEDYQDQISALNDMLKEGEDSLEAVNGELLQLEKKLKDYESLPPPNEPVPEPPKEAPKDILTFSIRPKTCNGDRSLITIWVDPTKHGVIYEGNCFTAPRIFRRKGENIQPQVVKPEDFLTDQENNTPIVDMSPKNADDIVVKVKKAPHPPKNSRYRIMHTVIYDMKARLVLQNSISAKHGGWMDRWNAQH